MLTDMISFLIALIAILFSSKKCGENNTFGWKRAEILGGLINSVFLIALCFSIIVEAFQRFFEPHELKNVNLILIVGTVGFGLNLFGLALFGLYGKLIENQSGIFYFKIK